MKSVPITELRQRAAEVIEEVGASDEPTVVLQRSRKAAYIVRPERFEQDQAELRALRRALFLTEVREAEAEYQAGESREFDDMEAFLDELRGA
jgi:prevent-host-death family protein